MAGKGDQLLVLAGPRSADLVVGITSLLVDVGEAQDGGIRHAGIDQHLVVARDEILEKDARLER